MGCSSNGYIKIVDVPRRVWTILQRTSRLFFLQIGCLGEELNLLLMLNKNLVFFHLQIEGTIFYLELFDADLFIDACDASFMAPFYQ